MAANSNNKASSKNVAAAAVPIKTTTMPLPLPPSPGGGGAGCSDMRPAVGPNPVRHLLQRQLGNTVIGFRQRLYRERLAGARNLCRRDLIAHYGCVNAIEFSDEGELLVSGGDDRRILLWRMADAMAGTGRPVTMEKQHQSNIFSLAVTHDNAKILSGGNDDQVMVHDLRTAEHQESFAHAKPVYGISLDPINPHIFATAGEDGRCLIFDMRACGSEVQTLARYRSPFHAVQFHPLDGNFAITANGKEGAAFWDLRHAKIPTIRYGGDDAAQSCMNVRFSGLGHQVLALRRRLPPILYNTCSPVAVCQFYHQDYYNSCTMKSCCFAGDNDEYVLSGSDDFNLYVWRLADANSEATNQWIDTYQMVLYGHRSIVNQVRYNAQRCVLASSGVEKVIKLWTPFAAQGWRGDSLAEDASGCEQPREVYTHDEYMSIINTSGHSMTHDYSNQNTTEDPRMMAFFDSLVQREIEGWNSNDEIGSDASDQSSEHSSDGSSRTTSPTETSDEQFVQASGSVVYRRGRYTVKPRTIYANRIAYLIATKRNTLKRLALKGAAHRLMYRTTKRVGRKTTMRMTRSGTGKRAGRSNASKRTAVSHEDHDDNSNVDRPPRKLTKRRIQQHLNMSTYRLIRRKLKTGRHQRPCESPDTSSDADASSGAARAPNAATAAADDVGAAHHSAHAGFQPVASTSAGPSTSRGSGGPSTSAAKQPHAKYELISAQMRRAIHANRSLCASGATASTSAAAAAVAGTSGMKRGHHSAAAVSMAAQSDDDDSDHSLDESDTIEDDSDDSDDDDDFDHRHQHVRTAASVAHAHHGSAPYAAPNGVTHAAAALQPRFPTNIAVPSTSTGITSTSGQIFRAQLQQRLLHDSEDEEDDTTPPNSRSESPLHMVRVIPMPINGTRNFNATYSSSGLDERDDDDEDEDDLDDDDDDLDSSPMRQPHHMNFATDDDDDEDDSQLERQFHHSQVRRKRNAPPMLSHHYPNHQQHPLASTSSSSLSARHGGGGQQHLQHYAQYSSHSNSRLSNSSPDRAGDLLHGGAAGSSSSRDGASAATAASSAAVGTSAFFSKKQRLHGQFDGVGRSTITSHHQHHHHRSPLGRSTGAGTSASMAAAAGLDRTPAACSSNRPQPHYHNNRHRHSVEYTPDSGIAMTMPHSASSASNSFQNHSSCSSSGGGGNGGMGTDAGAGSSSFRHHFDTTVSGGTGSAAGSSATAIAGTSSCTAAIASTSQQHRLFQQKVARVRRNYRHNFDAADDSDSD